MSVRLKNSCDTSEVVLSSCIFSRLHVYLTCTCFFFCKQKTAYDMRISDWSSDVCSSDLSNIQFKRRHSRSVSTTLAGRAVLQMDQTPNQIGRASCRERVCQYV